MVLLRAKASWAGTAATLVLSASCPTGSPDGTPSPETASPSAPTSSIPSSPSQSVVVSWEGFDLDVGLASRKVQETAPTLRVEFVPGPAPADLRLRLVGGAWSPDRTAAPRPWPQDELAEVPAWMRSDRAVVVALLPIQWWAANDQKPLATAWEQIEGLDPRAIRQADPSEPEGRQLSGALLQTKGPGAARRFLRGIRTHLQLVPPIPTSADVEAAILRGEAQGVLARLHLVGARGHPLLVAGREVALPLVLELGADGATPAAVAFLRAMRAPSVSAVFRDLAFVPASEAGDRFIELSLSEAGPRAAAVERLLVQVGFRPGIDDGAPAEGEVPLDPPPPAGP